MEIRVVEPNTINKWDEDATEEFTLLVKDARCGANGGMWMAKVVVKDDDDLNELLDEAMDYRDTFMVVNMDELKKAIKEFESGD